PLTDRDAEVSGLGEERQTLDLARQPPGNLLGQRGFAAGKDRRELLATDTTEQIARAQGGRRRACYPRQHLIAHLMPVGVVDLLEVIDIQQQERQGTATLAGVFELRAGLLEEIAAVAALGKAIQCGQTMQFAF